MHCAGMQLGSGRRGDRQAPHKHKQAGSARAHTCRLPRLGRLVLALLLVLLNATRRWLVDGPAMQGEACMLMAAQVLNGTGRCTPVT